MHFGVVLKWLGVFSGVATDLRQYITVLSVTNSGFHNLPLIDIRFLVFDWFTIFYPQIQVISNE